MAKSFKPPKHVIDDACIVWEFAGCDMIEIKHEKNKILTNFEEVSESYRIMANNIRGGVI